MPHYTTWGGTYVTRPVAREDRSPIQSDGDFNDAVFHSKQADGFMKLDDIRGEFSPSRQADGVSDQVAQFTTGGGGDSVYQEPDTSDPGPGYRSNWDAICDVGTAIKQTSVADALTNAATYRLKDVIITSFDNADAQTNHGTDGYTEVEWTYLTNGGSTPLQENRANGNKLDKSSTKYNPGKGASFGAEQGEGWIIIESMVNQDNMQGLDAGGMNYAEAVGLDSSTVDVVNNLDSICGGCGRHGMPH